VPKTPNKSNQQEEGKNTGGVDDIMVQKKKEENDTYTQGKSIATW
jgi:hypothetical protein